MSSPSLPTQYWKAHCKGLTELQPLPRIFIVLRHAEYGLRLTADCTVLPDLGVEAHLRHEQAILVDFGDPIFLGPGNCHVMPFWRPLHKVGSDAVLVGSSATLPIHIRPQIYIL